MIVLHGVSQVVALLNEAATTAKEQHKIQNLRTVQELITQRDAALLDNFLDEVLAFQNDRSVDVKKYVSSQTIHFLLSWQLADTMSNVYVTVTF